MSYIHPSDSKLIKIVTVLGPGCYKINQLLTKYLIN